MTTVPVYQWQPSTAEIARRAGIEPEQVVRFDHNTSPFAPPWAHETARAAARNFNEYPAADYRPLRAAAARRAGVAPDQVVAGAGIDELIDLCAKAFLGPGDAAVADAPTYSVYGIATRRRGAEFGAVDRPPPSFALPTSDLVGAAAGAAVTWLCQPANPIGTRAPDADIAALVAAAAGIVVLDGAYAEFAGDRWAPWLERHPNLVVLHTLSKAHGLASIRVGYSVSSPELAARLDAVRPPGSISSISAALAIRALDDPAFATDNASAIGAERSRLAGLLGGLGLGVLPSVVNFLLCEIGPQAGAVERALMAEGLVVRSFRQGALTDHLRFTVRSPEENDRLIDALERNLS